MSTTNSLDRRNRENVKRILESQFPGSEYILTEKFVASRGGREYLDRYFGIDGFLKAQSGQYWTVQTKVRSYRYFGLKTYPDQSGPDITLEYKNNHGLDNEYPGEFFHLGAQLYLYAWERKTENGIYRWVLLNTAAYKANIEAQGGLDAIGCFRVNETYSRASFYTIPLERLERAVVAHSGNIQWW